MTICPHCSNKDAEIERLKKQNCDLNELYGNQFSTNVDLVNENATLKQQVAALRDFLNKIAETRVNSDRFSMINASDLWEVKRLASEALRTLASAQVTAQDKSWEAENPCENCSYGRVSPAGTGNILCAHKDTCPNKPSGLGVR